MNLILLGPQGSGKGTQAELLVEKYGLTYVETGKILRTVTESGTYDYSNIVKDYMDKGLLVPEEYVKQIVWDYMNKQDKNKGFLFDGYPRSQQQYEQLKEMLMIFGKKIDRVIYLDIPEEETMRRLTSRRTCEKCGKIFNLITNPPTVSEVCDDCGGRLDHREDDKPEAIKQRLRAFKNNTKPVLEEAREEGVLVEIDGKRGIQDIHKKIVKKLNGDVNV